MSFLYNAMFFMIDFAVLLIFSILAIIFAEKLSAWKWYLIGAIIQLILVVGRNSTTDWIIYFVLLMITACIILVRYSNFQETMEQHRKNAENIPKLFNDSNKNNGFIICSECGTENPRGSRNCRNCRKPLL